MKKLLKKSYFWIILIALGIVGSVCKNNEKNVSNNSVKGDINQIVVTNEAQDIFDGKQKIVVWVQNNSNLIFEGNLRFDIKSSIDDSKIGGDTIFIENLQPSQKTYALVWSKPSSNSTAEYEWSSIKFTKDSNVTVDATAPYKFLKEKKESGGTIVPQIEFYLAKDRDFDKMYKFIKNRKVNKGVFYHAVFVDDEKYAQFSKYPIISMTYDDEQSKHIIATYWHNTENGNHEFSFYEKNSFESVAQSRRD